MPHWHIIATTEVPGGGKISPTAVIGVWTYEGEWDAMWAYVRGLPLKDAAHVAFTRLS